MTAARSKYVPRKIKWLRTVPKMPADSKQALLVAFVDGREDSQKTLRALQDPRVAKLHERFRFVRRSYRKGTKEMRDWNVLRAPTLIVLAPGKPEPLGRTSEAQNPWDLKKFLKEALDKLDKSGERGK